MFLKNLLQCFLAQVILYEFRFTNGLVLDRPQLTFLIPTYRTNTFFDLSYKQITPIEANTFDGLTHVQRLDLHNNQLKSLDTSMFNSLTNLIRLDLGYNQLQLVCFNITTCRT